MFLQCQKSAMAISSCVLLDWRMSFGCDFSMAFWTDALMDGWLVRSRTVLVLFDRPITPNPKEFLEDSLLPRFLFLAARALVECANLSATKLSCSSPTCFLASILGVSFFEEFFVHFKVLFGDHCFTYCNAISHTLCKMRNSTSVVSMLVEEATPLAYPPQDAILLTQVTIVVFPNGFGGCWWRLLVGQIFHISRCCWCCGCCRCVWCWCYQQVVPSWQALVKALFVLARRY